MHNNYRPMITIMITITFGCKYARCNQYNHMFFHVSFHKYTPPYANTDNTYLFHVLIGKAIVIDVIICDYSNYYICLIIITITDYTVSGKMIMIMITAKNVINCNRLRLQL